VWQSVGERGIVDALFGLQGLFSPRWVLTAPERFHLQELLIGRADRLR
jgi:hypothetical protein